MKPFWKRFSRSPETPVQQSEFVANTTISKATHVTFGYENNWLIVQQRSAYDASDTTEIRIDMLRKLINTCEIDVRNLEKLPVHAGFKIPPKYVPEFISALKISFPNLPPIMDKPSTANFLIQRASL